MPEAITLTTPIVPVSITGYRPVSLVITMLPAATVVVTLIDTAGAIQLFQYPSPAGTAMDTIAKVQTMITALNIANLTTRSLWQRIFDRLLLDFPGRFPGGATVV